MSPIDRLLKQEADLARELETRVRIPANVGHAMRARLADIGEAIAWIRGEHSDLSIRGMIQVDWAHKGVSDV